MKKWLIYLLLLLVALYAASGFYQVPAGQIALVQRFGKLLPDAQSSGLHYALPWDVIHRVALSELRLLSVGFDEPDGIDTADAITFTSGPRITSLLTGDNQLANLRVNISYRVDAEKVAEFVIANETRETILRRAAEETLVRTLAMEKVDAVILGRAVGLESKLQTHLSQRLNSYNLGVVIDSVNITQAQPPAELAETFRNVNRARTEKETAEREAWSQREGQISIARQYGKRVQSLAESNADQKKKLASAEAAAFKILLDSLPRDATARSAAMVQLYLNEMIPLLGRITVKTLSSDKASHYVVVPLPGK